VRPALIIARTFYALSLSMTSPERTGIFRFSFPTLGFCNTAPNSVRSLYVKTKISYYVPLTNRDGSVDIATGWTVRVRFPAEARDFSFHNAHTCSGAHATSSPVGTGGFHSEMKRPGSPEVKNDGAIPPLPICLYGIALNYIIKYGKVLLLP
jgi:hypothetical protein